MYEIDFGRMVQTNQLTRQEWKLQRQECRYFHELRDARQEMVLLHAEVATCRKVIHQERLKVAHQAHEVAVLRQGLQEQKAEAACAAKEALALKFSIHEKEVAVSNLYAQVSRQCQEEAKLHRQLEASSREVADCRKLAQLERHKRTQELVELQESLDSQQQQLKQRLYKADRSEEQLKAASAEAMAARSGLVDAHCAVEAQRKACERLRRQAVTAWGDEEYQSEQQRGTCRRVKFHAFRCGA